MPGRQLDRWMCVIGLMIAVAAAPAGAEPGAAYAVSSVGDATPRAYQWHNTAQGVHARFSEAGLRLTPAHAQSSWWWGLRLAGYGRAGQMVELRAAELSAQGYELRAVHDGLAEWYRNDPSGIEHGFTLDAVPAGDRALPVALELEILGTLESRRDSRAGIVFAGPANRPYLKYEELHAHDASGRALPAALELVGSDQRRLRIEIDDRGAQYPITVDPIITLGVKILASDGLAFDQFGWSVDLEGDTGVIGAWGVNEGEILGGAVYVVERDLGGLENWGQRKKILAAIPVVSGELGHSVSLSGDTLLAGAPGETSAYVFERNLGGANAWGQRRRISTAQPEFGSAAGLDQDTAIIGAWSDDSLGVNAGAALIYERDQGGNNNWGVVSSLVPSDWEAGKEFGLSVAISNDTVVVGAPGDTELGNNAGAAYVFERDLPFANAWGLAKKLMPLDPQADDEFGTSVAIQGDNIVVGSIKDDELGSQSGSAYLFGRDIGGADNWGEFLKLIPVDGGTGDQFGSSVAIDGDAVVVGARFDDFAGAQTGSAYGFRQIGATSWMPVGNLQAFDADAGDWFGSAVAVSGVTALIGARAEQELGESAGAAYTYELPDPPRCGDVNFDEVVDAVDVAVFQQHLTDPAGNPLGIDGENRCTVIGPRRFCDIRDVAVMKRALASMGPGLQPFCLIFFPAICGDISLDGLLDFSDTGLFQTYLADPTNVYLPLTSLDRCTTIGTPRPCDALDLSVLRRDLYAMIPGIAPVCGALQP